MEYKNIMAIEPGKRGENKLKKRSPPGWKKSNTEAIWLDKRSHLTVRQWGADF